MQDTQNQQIQQSDNSGFPQQDFSTGAQQSQVADQSVVGDTANYPVNTQFPQTISPSTFQTPTDQTQSFQPQDPSFLNNQTPVSVHGGTPESAPIPVVTETPGENIEYGYERLRQIENTEAELEKVENKESLNQNSQDELKTETKPQDTPVPPPIVKPQGPKVFGYYIPPAITSNLASIRNKKGTGDPQEARTWIFVLLDKLLKKQTYQQ